MTKLNGYQLFGPITDEQPGDPWREEMEILMNDANSLISFMEYVERDFKETSSDGTDAITLKIQTEYNLGTLSKKINKFLKSNAWAL